MDLFGTKQITALKKQLELANRRIQTLQSDVRILNQENDELKAKYEPRNGPHIVRNSSNSSMKSVSGDISQQPASKVVSVQPPQYASSGDLTSVALMGSAVGLSLSTNSDLCSCSSEVNIGFMPPSTD